MEGITVMLCLRCCTIKLVLYVDTRGLVPWLLLQVIHPGSVVPEGCPLNWSRVSLLFAYSFWTRKPASRRHTAHAPYPGVGDRGVQSDHGHSWPDPFFGERGWTRVGSDLVLTVLVLRMGGEQEQGAGPVIPDHDHYCPSASWPNPSFGWGTGAGRAWSSHSRSRSLLFRCFLTWSFLGGMEIYPMIHCQGWRYWDPMLWCLGLRGSCPIASWYKFPVQPPSYSTCPEGGVPSLTLAKVGGGPCFLTSPP